MILPNVAELNKQIVKYACIVYNVFVEFRGSLLPMLFDGAQLLELHPCHAASYVLPLSRSPGHLQVSFSFYILLSSPDTVLYHRVNTVL